MFRNNRALADGDGMTHLGRALDVLDIEIICATRRRPRAERANSTLQDRLVKAMRLEGISSIAEANCFLPSYFAQHNARFACMPADPQDAHRPLVAHENVEAELVWRVERSVTGALALHYNKAMFIPEPTPLARTLARKRVHVCEFPDGRIEVRHGDVVLPYRVYDKMQPVNQAEIVENKRLGAALVMAQAMQAARPHHRKRNNSEPVRSSTSVGVFASPPPAEPKIDRSTLCEPKIKRIALPKGAPGI